MYKNASPDIINMDRKNLRTSKHYIRHGGPEQYFFVFFLL